MVAIVAFLSLLHDTQGRNTFGNVSLVFLGGYLKTQEYLVKLFEKLSKVRPQA